MARFSQEDVFPLIADAIRSRHAQTGEFVRHDELVQALLNDPRGDRLVQSAHESDEDGKSREWWASNTVQWFSQRITDGSSDYGAMFEREIVDGSWAYRPSDRG